VRDRSQEGRQRTAWVTSCPAYKAEAKRTAKQVKPCRVGFWAWRGDAGGQGRDAADVDGCSSGDWGYFLRYYWGRWAYCAFVLRGWS